MESSADQPPEETDPDEEKPLVKPRTRTEATPFSTSTILIYISVFGSKYMFCAIETILPLYFRNILGYSENASTIVYQLFDGFSFILPIFMAIFGDSLLGRFKSSVYFSGIMTVGNILLATAAMSLMSIRAEVALTVVALIIVIIGFSGLTPVQTSFGGDQFVLPRQQAEVTKFFAIFYFAVCLACAISNAVTPLLRNDVHCLGRKTCYSLGFGVPIVVMLIAIVPFAAGKRLYRIKRISSRQSALTTTFQCIAYAIGNQNVENAEHWLDKASDKYGQQFVNDVKALLHLSTLFIPCIFFYSLWTQVGSTWTFQATRMSGYVAPGVYIKPDQVQMTNSILLLALIPLFDFIIYPVLGIIGLLKKLLQRMAFGSILIALSFVCAGMLELELQKSYPVLPSTDETTFNVINALPCPIDVSIEPIFLQNAVVPNFSVLSYNNAILAYENSWFQNIKAVDYNITATMKNCTEDEEVLNIANIEYLSQPKQVHTFLVTWADENRTTGRIISAVTDEDLFKSKEGDAKLRIIGGDLPVNITTFEIKLNSQSGSHTFFLSPADAETLATEIDPDVYFVTLSMQKTISSGAINVDFGHVNLEQGGSYLIAIFPSSSGRLGMETYVLTPPNLVHMIWQLPQYFLLTVAELLLVISGYQYAYEQAPRSMKSLLQSVWLLPIGLGDLIVVVISAFNVFPNQAYTFFFYVLLMLFGTTWFIISAYRYKPQIITEEPPTVPTTPVRKRRRKSVAESMAFHVNK